MSITDKLNIRDKLVDLIQKDNFVGWVYNVNYEDALIITNDEWKQNVSGIPHNSFLIATSFDVDKYSEIDEIDKQIILLRVTGACKLPQDDEMVKTRIDGFQKQKAIFEESKNEEYDIFTKNKMQFSGLKCRVLGTFYIKNEDLVLGSDIETFYSSLKLNVYMPKLNALEVIVNYVDPIRKNNYKKELMTLGIDRDIEPFKIGTVRYTSTDRLHRSNIDDLVPFKIQPSDFLARRTAVLGMTRTGKSNMVKQTISVVKDMSKKCNLPIGQLIYDVNGEYANSNKKDKGSISEIYKKECIKYRSIPTDGFVTLLNNFYVQLQEGYTIICDCIKEKSTSSAADLSLFMSGISFDEPDDINEKKKYRQKIALYKTVLAAAKFDVPSYYKVKFEANEDLRKLVDCDVNPNDGLTLQQSIEWFTKLRKIKTEIKKELEIKKNSKKEVEVQYSEKDEKVVSKWITEEMRILLNMLYMKNDSDKFFNGIKSIFNAQKYHVFARENDVRNEIYEELCDGKIVILDLSVGNAMIRQKVSKDIAEYIFNKSMNDFTNDKNPSNIVVYIEEAHNLIGKGMELTDTWPRLAKEGAKYNIALVYATQEVSSVHPNILSNTENWFVTHLNSEKEMSELAKFYDFADFSQSLLRSQDVGFARVKTLSSPFVIPIQIDKFDPDKILKEHALDE